jgi:hypothetical protein
VHGTGCGVEVEGPTSVQGDRSGVAESRDVTGVEAEAGGGSGRGGGRDSQQSQEWDGESGD